MQKDQKSYTILVLEDNPGDYYLIRDFLEEEIVAPEILHAEKFSEASALLKERPDEIDAILLDLSLPDFTGEELLKKIVPLAQGTPIIILTGYTDFDFAVKAISLGAYDYLLKENLTSTILHKSIIYNLERSRSLKKLKESQKRYSELFHLSPQPMWVFDLVTLQFLDVNKAAIETYGYSYEEFLQMKLNDIRPENGIKKMLDDVAEIREKKSHFSYNDHQHKKKNGELITVEIRGNKIEYDRKRAGIVLASDVTERNRYMNAIEEQNKKLREIAWTQSHIVRAPLARIMGLVEIMGYKNISMAEKEEMLQYVMFSARELDETLREIVNKTQNDINMEQISGSD